MRKNLSRVKIPEYLRAQYERVMSWTPPGRTQNSKLDFRAIARKLATQSRQTQNYNSKVKSLRKILGLDRLDKERSNLLGKSSKAARLVRQLADQVGPRQRSKLAKSLGAKLFHLRGVQNRVPPPRWQAEAQAEAMTPRTVGRRGNQGSSHEEVSSQNFTSNFASSLWRVWEKGRWCWEKIWKLWERLKIKKLKIRITEVRPHPNYSNLRQGNALDGSSQTSVNTGRGAALSRCGKVGKGSWRKHLKYQRCQGHSTLEVLVN